jgi:hypothetical protein
MVNPYDSPPEANTEKEKEKVQQKRTYEKPRLEVLGDLRSFTLGVTWGPAESGGGGYVENGFPL